MDEALIKNWNDVVTRKDTTYIIGDFAWRDHAKYFNSLNGKKILVKGNHDKMPQVVYDNFTRIYTGIADIKIDKQKITLCHFPMYSWNCSVHGAWHLHGHTHNSPFKHPGLAINVGVDMWDYKPVSWKVIKDQLEKFALTHKPDDHHH